ncbi:hypothetical protein V6N11_039132 [Hibiscus sabdariffa]|uniref:Uncharacterized protein n=1 Tax=Hibiscus sabdariffa TaxID=183260 RepID=A0ABR2SM25_9ROSI
MVVRKIEVQNVDVKDDETMILECSRVPLVGAISSDSEDQTEGLIAPMKDGSLKSSVSLHDTVKVTKTLYPLSVALPLVAKASTVVDVIASTAAKFTLHDIFRKVGITEPIRNYFIGNRNSNAVLNLVEHDKPSYWPKYLGNSQLTVTNVELSEHWTCNMNLKYGVPIGMQDRNGNLVFRGEPNCKQFLKSGNSKVFLFICMEIILLLNDALFSLTFFCQYALVCAAIHRTYLSHGESFCMVT